MNISNEIINTTEDKIKAFYRQMIELERFNHKLNMLIRHKEEIQKDIDSSNITLNSCLKGINFSNDKVQTSAIISPQEAELDSAFARLENQLKKAEEAIIDTKLSIRELEKKNSDTEFLINKLNDQAKRFVLLRYKENKSMKAIGDKLYISEAGAWRMRETILGDLSKWICAYF